VKPAVFTYHRATDLAAACALLAEHGDEAKLIAGGVSLVPVMNMRLARPSHLVDISRIEGLRSIQQEQETLRIGALTTHEEVVRHPLVGTLVPLLVQAGQEIGHAAIRNRGTIGGSLAHADPSAEWAVALSALDASVRVVSREGERTVPVRELFLTYYTTTLDVGEIIAEVIVPIARSRMRWSFMEYARRKGDFAQAAVACGVAVTDGQISETVIYLGGINPVPERLAAAEEALLHAPAVPAAWAAAADAAAAELEPLVEDPQADPYLRHLVRTLVYRALEQAALLGVDQ
jgi:carbon-monoxide dehydrogenase medium subunit